MNKAVLLRRLEQLERQFTPPPSFQAQVVATATDAQLDALEVELAGRGDSPTWDALVAAYRSEVGRS